jgi:phage host-nuclease inhibitor protein Gam
VAFTNSDALSRTLLELATDLAGSRRDCRQRDAEIAALKREITALRTDIAGLCVADSQLTHTTDVQQGSVQTRRRDRLEAPSAHHEHTIAWMSNAVSMLRRGTVALKQENASLRRELMLADKRTRPTASATANLHSARSLGAHDGDGASALPKDDVRLVGDGR